MAMAAANPTITPPAFEEPSYQPRRASVVPARFESAANRQLEILGEVEPLSSPASTTNLGVQTSPPLAQDEGHEHHDEELPGYFSEETHSPSSALPGYAERHLLAPVVSYNMYQISRKLQVFTPATRATFHRPRYRITGRSGPSLFSKKPDFTLTRLPTGAAAAAERSAGKDVGFVSFDRSARVPWMPRANIEIIADQAACQTARPDGGGIHKKLQYAMSSPNFSDWKLPLSEPENSLLYWRLTAHPTALSLIESSSSSIVARFTYSKHGTDASRGAEVGVLDIFGGSRSGDTDRVELVLSTVVVPLNHWKNMGRHYRNDPDGVQSRISGMAGPGRNASVVVGGMGNSFFAGDGSGVRGDPRRASNAV